MLFLIFEIIDKNVSTQLYRYKVFINYLLYKKDVQTECELFKQIMKIKFCILKVHKNLQHE